MLTVSETDVITMHDPAQALSMSVPYHEDRADTIIVLVDTVYALDVSLFHKRYQLITNILVALCAKTRKIVNVASRAIASACPKVNASFLLRSCRSRQTRPST